MLNAEEPAETWTTRRARGTDGSESILIETNDLLDFELVRDVITRGGGGGGRLVIKRQTTFSRSVVGSVCGVPVLESMNIRKSNRTKREVLINSFKKASDQLQKHRHPVEK